VAGRRNRSIRRRRSLDSDDYRFIELETDAGGNGAGVTFYVNPNHVICCYDQGASACEVLLLQAIGDAVTSWQSLSVTNYNYDEFALAWMLAMQPSQSPRPLSQQFKR
jgi:hypothetical protein